MRWSRSSVASTESAHGEGRSRKVGAFRPTWAWGGSPPRESRPNRRAMEERSVRFMDSGQNYRRERGAWPKSRASCQQNGRYSPMLAARLFRCCRVLSRTYQRSPSVIRQFSLLAALLPALLFGQDTAGGPHAGLIAHLQALGGGSDAAKDSISALVKEQL